MPSLKQLIKKPVHALSSRFATSRLERVVREIEDAKMEELSHSTFLETKIRQIGLRHDRRALYGDDVDDMNFHAPGLWQIPRQLAQAMALLAGQRIVSFLEVGTCDGFTFSFMAACLSRLNPGLKATTIDIASRLPTCARIVFKTPVEFLAGKTSDAFAGHVFDLVLIDGDHSYEWITRDYRNVGQQARLCMFHDINDRFCGDDTVPKFWRELKTEESGRADFHEFLYHSNADRVMGIGIRIKR
ncbi:class I SAM-dependent methyltransferase [Mesorhizobium loti]|uniref:Class I SAM-dependent methyltransferase n=1 Tax=Mesorhizobium loti R88b TaxID=935548 RepID=A0A6M7WM31_RHILI|nr:class I SAM-dependent methyltransferase [Mesorhizobium loti]QKD00984.1 class I SAM-dependent methyltransferase [Mesorhizobium loti R88b]